LVKSERPFTPHVQERQRREEVERSRRLEEEERLRRIELLEAEQRLLEESRAAIDRAAVAAVEAAAKEAAAAATAAANRREAAEAAAQAKAAALAAAAERKRERERMQTPFAVTIQRHVRGLLVRRRLPTMRRAYKLAVLLGDRPDANPSPPVAVAGVPAPGAHTSVGVVRTIAQGDVALGENPSLQPAFSASPTRTRDGWSAEAAAGSARSRGGDAGAAVRMSVMDQSSLFGLAREAAEYVPELSSTREAVEATDTTIVTPQELEEASKVHAANTAAAVAALGGAVIAPIDDEGSGGAMAEMDHDVVCLRPNVVSSSVRSCWPPPSHKCRSVRLALEPGLKVLNVRVSNRRLRATVARQDLSLAMGGLSPSWRSATQLEHVWEIRGCPHAEVALR
jgi:hypothetical protein